MVAGSSVARPDRDQDQVEADVGATRDRLVAAVENLVDRVHPQRIKQREVAGAKHFARTELETLRLLVFNAAGDLRTERLTKVGGGAAGFLGLLLVLRSLVARNRSRSAGRGAGSGGPAPSKRAARRNAKAAERSAEVLERASRSARKARPRTAQAVADGPAEVRPTPAARSARKAPAAAAPVGLDDVETRVRRARRKA